MQRLWVTRPSLSLDALQSQRALYHCPAYESPNAQVQMHDFRQGGLLADPAAVPATSATRDSCRSPLGSADSFASAAASRPGTASLALGSTARRLALSALSCNSAARITKSWDSECSSEGPLTRCRGVLLCLWHWLVLWCRPRLLSLPISTTSTLSLGTLSIL